MLVSFTPHLDAVSRHGSEFTTEPQSAQRIVLFPWPEDDGQGNMPSPSARGTSVHEALRDVAFR